MFSALAIRIAANWISAGAASAARTRRRKRMIRRPCQANQAMAPTVHAGSRMSVRLKPARGGKEVTSDR
jgi:hypothetical protein